MTEFQCPSPGCAIDGKWDGSGQSGRSYTQFAIETRIATRIISSFNSSIRILSADYWIDRNISGYIFFFIAGFIQSCSFTIDIKCTMFSRSHSFVLLLVFFHSNLYFESIQSLLKLSNYKKPNLSLYEDDLYVNNNLEEETEDPNQEAGDRLQFTVHNDTIISFPSGIVSLSYDSNAINANDSSLSKSLSSEKDSLTSTLPDWLYNRTPSSKYNATHPFSVRIVGIFVADSELPYTLELAKPSIEIAIEKAKIMYPSIRWENAAFRNGSNRCTSNVAGVFAAEEFYLRRVTVFIGPSW